MHKPTISTYLEALFLLFATFCVLGSAETETISFDSGWRFRPDPKEVGISERWHETNYADESWAILDAGKRWEDQGFPDVDGYAWYRKDVNIPSEWDGRPVWLVFGGVNDSYVLYVNGKRVNAFGDLGEQSVHSTPTVAEVNRYIEAGARNSIAIQVYDWGASGGLWHLPCRITTDSTEVPAAPRIECHYPYDRNELSIVVDYLPCGNEIPSGKTRVELLRGDGRSPVFFREFPNPQKRSKATLTFSLDAVDTVNSLHVRVSLFDENGSLCLSFPVSRETKPPEKRSWPSGYEDLKILNNFVTELFTGEIDAETKQNLRFANPREGWVFFSLSPEEQFESDNDPIAYLDNEQDRFVFRKNEKSNAFESMRYLCAGRHSIRIDPDSGRTQKYRAIVRTIPELAFCYYPSSSNLPGQAVYDWEYMQKYVLPHVNVLITTGNYGKKEFEQWNREGRHWIGNSILPGLHDPVPPSPAEIYEVWSENEAVQNTGFSGLIVDEFLVTGDEHYRAWTGAIRKLHHDPDFREKCFYAFSGTIFDNPSEGVREFARYVIDTGDRFALERYLAELPTREEAEASLYRDLQQVYTASNHNFPGWGEHLVMCLGYLSAPPESVNLYPSINHRVFMEMQFRMLALDPTFWGLYGVMEYTASYADEEDLRWAHQLMRHYCIEGQTEWLSSDPYELPHLVNPDFMEGTDGWKVEAANPGSVRVEKMEGLSWLQGRYPSTEVGNQYLSMTRYKERPSRVRQTISDLEPGRLYALKVIACAPEELAEKQELVLRINLENADRIDQYSLHSVYPSNYAHTFGPYNRNHPAWFNYWKVVFRPKGEEVELSISDWASPTSSGGPEGQTIGFNFVEIQPFLEP